MDFKNLLHKKAEQIDLALEEILPKEIGHQDIIFQSMRYSVFAGGKRLRPILMLAASDFVGGNEKDVLPFCCAIEMIHTYSLIHDDLPAMDNDDFRRGKLTNHKVYGEGIAVLAGDGLLNYAYEIMLKSILQGGADSKRKIMAMEEITRAAGIYGMIGGQVVDLASENKQIDGETLDYIHNHKTAALIIAAIRAGAIIGGADDHTLKCLTEYGKCIGLGFQITDDLLDIFGNEEKLGKKIGSDIENNKSTYPSIHGIDQSIAKVNELFHRSLAVLQEFDTKSAFFMELADYLVKRDY
ncbi:MAG: polyprenyl synthetase family protein [Anaerosolibacter sp.]|jgi:geranylgeranyl diphosphate synthase type II|uniref:polyprenyl synthetase family protein n=1 Tax=Anaerosolibacter sp. TaxID=1872527 RepID=UPI0026032014|nr:farnesyl diphosphate synthase [Anaerosolibacter sp.]MDF2546461.1 polyprenyl synthetase family protein [Anaerosolibacter sp.]